MSAPVVEHVIVLRSRSGIMTKRIGQTAEGWRIVPFSAGMWYAARPQPVADFHELTALLCRVSADAYAGIVRGVLLPGVDAQRCRRLCDRTLHGDAVTFGPSPRRWLALDVDGVADPDCFPADPAGGVEHVLGLLPEPFADASCWWQATGSAGVKPGIRCRLWFWLSRSVSDAEAKGWLAGYPVDRSLFTPVALHYTAAPILEPGSRDPVIQRSGMRQGFTDTVEVPDTLPVAAPAVVGPGIDLTGAEPSEENLVALAAALLNSPHAAAMWIGERTYPDRSQAHFALAAALARGGCTDPDTLHQALIAHDRRHGRDLNKILRPDYAARTIRAVLAVEGQRP